MRASIAAEKDFAVTELVIFASNALYGGSIMGNNAGSTMTLTEELGRHLVLLAAVIESSE
jgi:hypothetical protein